MIPAPRYSKSCYFSHNLRTFTLRNKPVRLLSRDVGRIALVCAQRRDLPAAAEPATLLLCSIAFAAVALDVGNGHWLDGVDAAVHEAVVDSVPASSRYVVSGLESFWRGEIDAGGDLPTGS